MTRHMCSMNQCHERIRRKRGGETERAGEHARGEHRHPDEPLASAAHRELVAADARRRSDEIGDRRDRHSGPCGGRRAAGNLQLLREHDESDEP